MSLAAITQKQKDLFEALSTMGTLIFAAGPPGISANLVGDFKIRKYKGGKEDRLDVDDGTHHVHIDWSKVERCELGDFRGEGLITFYEGQNILFKLYRPSGAYSHGVVTQIGGLI